jgi:hypothetical protein
MKNYIKTKGDFGEYEYCVFCGAHLELVTVSEVGKENTFEAILSHEPHCVVPIVRVMCEEIKVNKEMDELEKIFC